jgi:hypothetical protein
VVRDRALVRSEWGVHTLDLKNVTAKVLVVNDHWQDRPADAPFFSSAFTTGAGSASITGVSTLGFLVVVFLVSTVISSLPINLISPVFSSTS